MNLTTDPWIPVASRKGAYSFASLDELFARSADIWDLVVKPHERIALLRLLICVTQAALDGPSDRSTWEQCRDEIPDRPRDYLRKWKASFELFGNGPRFLQVPNLKAAKEDGEGNAATKLDLTLATGNNATVFDNAGGSERPRTPAQLALALLTFQCFSPGGRIGVAKWGGKDTPGGGSSNHAPCIPSSMLHCFMTGATLLETLHLNLLDREQASDSFGPDGWGKPIWEFPVASLSAKAEIHNATMTYLGRLVPLTRAVHLSEDGAEIILGNGLDYPIYPQFRESSATLIERKDGLGVMSASLERSLWRQLAAITVRRHAKKDAVSGPPALGNLPPGKGSAIWLGALVTDKAKIEDVVEAAYDLPAGMFQDTGRQVYEAGVNFAEDWDRAVGSSVKAYAGVLKLEAPRYEKAHRSFWTAVEQHVPALVALTEMPALAADFGATPWGKAVRAAAEEAYDFACPRQTPRQIEAFAKGRQQLYLKNASPKKEGEAAPGKTKRTRKP
ncbi:MAG: type I-E CRISPR-associated protein Cse1/CasA [Verrucomicrobiales bacterium]|nr:type I-E CRISPR-associated protein Cse1/CasA [Verrucomicrobiales bacterium]